MFVVGKCFCLKLPNGCTANLKNAQCHTFQHANTCDRHSGKTVVCGKQADSTSRATEQLFTKFNFDNNNNKETVVGEIRSHGKHGVVNESIKRMAKDICRVPRTKITNALNRTISG